MQHFHSEPEPQSVYTGATASPHNMGAPTDALDAAEQRRIQESIEDYLDRVCRPLMDTLPYAARQELRREIAQHLNALVHAYRESGYAPALATEKALDKFGPPHLVAQKWNPVTVREGQYKRMERWFTGQWQGIAATLALCSIAGLLGLMGHYSGALSPHRLMPRSQPAVTSVATPATPALPFTYTPMAAEPAKIAELTAQVEPAKNAELTAQQAALNQAHAELIAAQDGLAAQQAALQQAQLSAAHVLTSFASSLTYTEDHQRGHKEAEAREQQIFLDQQKVDLRQRQLEVLNQLETVNREAARLETIKSLRGHRGL